MWMPMSCSDIPFKILSDGHTLYVVTGECVYKITRPLLKSVNLVTHREMIEFFDGQRQRQRQGLLGLLSFDLSLETTGSHIDVIHNKDIVLDFFQSVSIRDLLKEINKKIAER